MITFGWLGNPDSQEGIATFFPNTPEQFDLPLPSFSIANDINNKIHAQLVKHFGLGQESIRNKLKNL